MVEDNERLRLRSLLAQVPSKMGLRKDRTKKQWICPICGSGSHKNGTSAFSIEGEVFHCFACGNSGDIFNLVAAMDGINANADFLEVVAKTYELLGEVAPTSDCEAHRKSYQDGRRTASDAFCELEHQKSSNVAVASIKTQNTAMQNTDLVEGNAEEFSDCETHRKSYQDGRRTASDAFCELEHQKSSNVAVASIKTQNTAMQNTDLVEGNAEESIVRHDYSNDIAKWQRNLKNAKKAMKYLLSRGLTEETILRFQIGYDERHWQPRLQKEEPSIVIPYGNDCAYYIARTIDGKEFHKPSQREAGLEPVFNCDSLYSDGNKTVFIVEGSLDAISIEQLGFKAVALSGTSHNPLMEQLQSKPTKSTLIIALDNDEAGKARSTKLRDELLNMGIRCVVKNLTEGLGYKDANEALVKNPEGLSIVLNRVVDEQSIANEFISDTLYLEKIFLKDQTQFKECKNIKTGFGLLDTRLGGGVFPGLHLIGASTSLGKTTFCHQVACHMASLGVKVLFFSLEMSRFQMVSRGIAREIARGNSSNAISALEVRKGEKKDRIDGGTERYKNLTKGNLHTMDPKFGYTVEELIKCTGRFIEQNSGEPVVVFVDYLQILKVDANGRKEPQRREEIDSIVTKLKQFSDDYQIPVFVVSSLSRGNYMLPVSLESFKESGGIEYTADVVIGLQLKCFGDNAVFDSGENKINKKRDAIREAMCKSPREIELLILKNRNGAIGESLFYKYHSRYDLFDNEDSGSGSKMPGTNSNGF
ncbi:hypothetical protein FACS189449_01340 [Alphaproteobacteria bacterium]|nr:hypothetical protein FACS189449_01340 [Alphaproteobacteria bacterium]